KAGAVLGDERQRRDWLPALRSDWAIDQKVGDPAGRRLSRLLLGDPRVVGDGAAGGAERLLRCQGGAIKFGKQKPIRLWIERFRFFGLFSGNGGTERFKSVSPLLSVSPSLRLSGSPFPCPFLRRRDRLAFRIVNLDLPELLERIGDLLRVA